MNFRNISSWCIRNPVGPIVLFVGLMLAGLISFAQMQVNDVRNAVAQIRGTLPDGILEPQITRIDADGEPISYVGAQTTDMTLEQLSWYIDNTVAKRLLGVPGIAAVQRVGGVDRTIRVILDPAALQAQGITAAQVNQQLRQSNMNGAGG